MVKNTAPVGTFCDIDLEYQRTGAGAVSAKSDVYALGVVVLQLPTGRMSPAAAGLAHTVETGLEGHGGGGDYFVEMLDAIAGSGLALQMRRKDRPGLR